MWEVLPHIMVSKDKRMIRNSPVGALVGVGVGVWVGLTVLPSGAGVTGTAVGVPATQRMEEVCSCKQNTEQRNKNAPVVGVGDEGVGDEGVGDEGDA